VTKQQIIRALREYAAKLGRTPSSAEFHKHVRLSRREVVKNFGNFTRLLTASGMERAKPETYIEPEKLFLDWARIVRKLRKVPSQVDYATYGKYSIRPYINRYRTWSNVPQNMQEWAVKNRFANQWQDVLQIVAEYLKTTKERSRSSRGSRRFGRPVYGRPMLGPFSFVPVNEQGVLFLFGLVAHELGFFITRVQTEFPDVEAMRETGPNQCQRMELELEYESRNFLAHLHPIDGCDGIVCWVHNWPECPLEVIELKSVVEQLVLKRSGHRKS